MSDIAMFLPENILELSLYSYEQFSDHGKGYVFITPDDTSERGFNFEYVSGEEANKVAREQIAQYNPDEEILFVIQQADGALGCVIQGFNIKASTPKYLYTVKKAIQG